ncbi:MAG: T9SS type A sorting domain-containing protein [Ignavibacteria bacterium]|nr:T9SS type A sorting domain-containing protein [Ignavibacteria bacterium]
MLQNCPGLFSCDHWTQSTSSMDVIFKRTSGSVSNIMGPAKEWRDMYWNPSVPLNSSLAFDIIGIDYSGNQTVIRQGVQTNKFVELSTIDPRQYPFLNLLARFNIDTVSGNSSPVLNSLNVSYAPAAEIVLNKNSLQFNSPEKKNNTTNFSFDYHNAGFAYIYGMVVNVYRGSVSDSNIILTDTVASVLKIDSTGSYANSFTTPALRDSTRIFISIKPKDFSNEFYSFNNTVDFRITSSASLAENKIEVTGDGKIINNGDFVSKNPEIKINLKKSGNQLLLSDTTQLLINLNGNYVPYFSSGKLNPVLKTIESDNQSSGNNITLAYFPVMENGKNKLSIIYKTDTDNNSDTVSYDVFVSDELMVTDFYNYPNPMKDETSFIFNLAGSVTQYQFKVKIYTVSGRLIKEINYNANIGNNEIPWDGRDNDGDIVANGTYLYKLILGEDSKSDLKVQKLVVLR